MVHFFCLKPPSGLIWHGVSQVKCSLCTDVSRVIIRLQICSTVVFFSEPASCKITFRWIRQPKNINKQTNKQENKQTIKGQSVTQAEAPPGGSPLSSSNWEGDSGREGSSYIQRRDYSLNAHLHCLPLPSSLYIIFILPVYYLYVTCILSVY